MVKGIVITRNTFLKSNKNFIELIGRDVNCEKFRILVPFSPYFFIREKDIDKAEIKESEYIDTNLKNFSGEKVVRLDFDTYEQLKNMEEILSEKGVELYESDVNQAQSFMNDLDLGTVIEFPKDQIKDDVLDKNSIKNAYSKDLDKLKRALIYISIDIETNYLTGEILCVSISTADRDECYITSEVKHANTTVCKDEKELIEKVKDRINEIKPDIITGWNVIDFDLEVLHNRAKKNNINFNIGLNNEELRIYKRKNFFTDSSAKTKGIQILDGISLCKQAFLKLSDYKLDTAAKELLGDSKIDIETTQEKPKEIIDLYNNYPEKLVEYNKKDARLVLDILDSKNILDIAIERSMATGIPMDRVKSAVATMESLYIKEARKRGFVVYNVAKNTKLEGISGGFVMASQPGLYDYILVLDYKSLYPSIIRTFNVDLMTAVQAGKNYISAPNGARFSKDQEGILPELVKKIWNLRDRAKQQKDDIKSYALKITMNSFFGVIANPNCRYFNYDVADAITNFGRYFIKRSIDYIEKKDYNVIYGDTDSLFILSKAKDKKHAIELGNRLEHEINEHFTRIIKEEYERKSVLQIEFEKTFIKFFMPSIRGSESGAKKRYAGLIVDKDKEKIDITGLEFVRSDWTLLARNFQYNLLDRIFHDKPYTDFIKDIIRKLKSGEMDHELIYRKKLTKPLEEYVKTTPPHVKAARMLDTITSNIVKYVMSKKGPVPVELLDKEDILFDYDHYIEKQLKPVADSILPMLGTSFDDVVKGNKQSTLDSFGK